VTSKNNCRAKGNRNVTRAKIVLTSIGYRVEDVEKRGRFVKQRDLYGLFDLIGIHKEQKPCLIQVTSNVAHTHIDYLAFAKDYANHLLILQMVYVDRAGWLGYIYNQDNTKIIVDGRKMKVPEFTELLKSNL
jgi:hypothetical protein